MLEHQPGGARLIRDEFITFLPGPGVALIRRLLNWRRNEAPVEGESPISIVASPGGDMDAKATGAEAAESANSASPSPEPKPRGPKALEQV